MDIQQLTDEMNKFVEAMGWYRPGSRAPQTPRNIAASLTVFVAENPKTARQYLKQLELATPLQDIEIFTLDKHTKP